MLYIFASEVSPPPPRQTRFFVTEKVDGAGEATEVVDSVPTPGCKEEEGMSLMVLDIQLLVR